MVISSMLILVDIGTEWNLEVRSALRLHGNTCRYRNRVEFRAQKAIVNEVYARSRYRNRVEFRVIP